MSLEMGLRAAIVFFAEDAVELVTQKHTGPCLNLPLLQAALKGCTNTTVKTVSSWYNLHQPVHFLICLWLRYLLLRLSSRGK